MPDLSIEEFRKKQIAALRNKNLTPLERIGFLNRVAATYVSYDNVKAKKWADKLAGFSKQTGHLAGLGFANGIYSELAEIQGKNFECIRYLEEAIQCFNPLTEKKYLSQA